jgi:hypothetical protein
LFFKKNINHTPKGGDKKIVSQKLDFKDKASSKIGSMEVSMNTNAE